MYLPTIADERTTLCEFIDVQLTALRASALGLAEDQARATPLRSTLSIAGILKHVTHVMVGSLVGAGVRQAEPADQDFEGSFTLAEGESLASVLARFDEVRQQYLELCRDGDLDEVMPVGPMPWFGMDEPRDASMRYLYVHHVEEFARHAGHADIIREQLDGAQSTALVAAVEGWEPNEYVTPWTPGAAS